jgi:hypothetical protein
MARNRRSVAVPWRWSFRLKMVFDVITWRVLHRFLPVFQLPPPVI